MTGCSSMKPSDGIRPVPCGSSARTCAALVSRQTGVWPASVSSTQAWLPVQPGAEPSLCWQVAVDLVAQRSLLGAAGSVTQICELVQALLQGGGGRLAFSTSGISVQSSRFKGWVFLATAYMR